MSSKEKKILGVIPARYDSSRLPGKPLADILGKTMIRRVYERASRSNMLDSLIVATDDKRIYDEVVSFGGECVLTRNGHTSGTSRLCEVMSKLPEYDFYINIQGDQPFIAKETVDEICTATLSMKGDSSVMTLVAELKEDEEDDISIPKVVVKKDGEAIYFSRFPIPFNTSLGKFDSSIYLKHLGVYGFTKKSLEKIKNFEVSYLEEAESLEQLTWIYEGISIYTKKGSDKNKISVDTKLDLEIAIEIAEKENDQQG
tara:strand:+ start:1752 stop:2522 length:771 start_codon:yes stop_codon:yes gene_type:complete